MNDAFGAFTNMKRNLMTKTLTLLKARIKRKRKEKKGAAQSPHLWKYQKKKRLGLTIQIKPQEIKASDSTTTRRNKREKKGGKRPRDWKNWVVRRTALFHPRWGPSVLLPNQGFYENKQEKKEKHLVSTWNTLSLYVIHILWWDPWCSWTLIFFYYYFFNIRDLNSSTCSYTNVLTNFSLAWDWSLIIYSIIIIGNII